MAEEQQFALERFEQLCYQRQHEEAARELIKLLRILDKSYGQLGLVGTSRSGTSWQEEQRDSHIITRLTSAMSALFSDPDFHVSVPGFHQFILLHRWIAMLFGASSFTNADHILHLLNLNGFDQPGNFEISQKNLLKFTMLYSGDSFISMQADMLWNANKKLAAALFLGLLSSRTVISEAAHKKKEVLLNWLPECLGELDDLSDIPLGYIHDVWMHCSYAMLANKHDIKRSINRLIRREMMNKGMTDREFGTEKNMIKGKPVVMVILEWFLSGHSIYRTHSTAARALREKYHLIGVSLSGMSDENSKKVFDEVYDIPHEQGLYKNVQRVMELVARFNPEIIYYPSVGMFLQTVVLINFRLAPIQMAALGHPATTHSEFIDYILVEEDYVGDPKCFSEKVAALPKDSLPYVPPHDDFTKIEPEIRSKPDVIKIAVAATAMKLNPDFLKTCRAIKESSKQPVEFHFLTGHAIGLGKVYIENFVNGILPGQYIYPHSNRDVYLQNMNRCDMFINPFPFGNTNGLVDTVRQALPGICLSGAEVLSHIDEGLFMRLGLPDWLVTHTVEEYIEASVRLVEDHGLRVQLSEQLKKQDPDEILFKGEPRNFLKSVSYLHENHEEIMRSDDNFLQLALLV